MATHGRGGIARFVLGSVAQGVSQHSSVPVLLVRPGMEHSASWPAFRRILIPLDGSPLAEPGLEFARSVAIRDATMVLVRVVEPILLGTLSTESGSRVDEPATHAALIEAAAEFRELATRLQRAGYTVQNHVRRGQARIEILAAIRESAADLVVMTTHGRTGAARWMLGSVADYVVAVRIRRCFW
jgi:nucleotide-binding universal stress UspA family protein